MIVFTVTTMLILSIIIIMMIVFLKHVLFKIEQNLIFRPIKINDSKFIAPKLNVGNNCTIEEINVNTVDNQQLNILHYKNPASSKYILYAHGNGGNIHGRMKFIETFGHIGSIILFDYRGYGKSTGDPTESGLYIDVTTIWKYVTDKLNIKPKNIILYGESLGCSIVSWLGKELVKKNDINELPRAIILQSGFYNIKEIASQLFSGFVKIFVNSKFDNNANIKEINGKIPILIAHGDGDDLINYYHAEKLYNNHKHNKNIRLCNISGTHNDPKFTFEFYELFKRL